MKENKEKFKQFVIEQLKDYDEWREASPDGYAELITDEAVKLFCQPDVIKSVCLCEKPNFDEDPNDNEIFCIKCGQNKRQTVL